jgi:hypothetical protein
MTDAQASTGSGLRLGVDVGGTFTDLVLADGDHVQIAKVPSTPDDQAVGILAGVDDLGVSPADLARWRTARPSRPTRCWSATVPARRAGHHRRVPATC